MRDDLHIVVNESNNTCGCTFSYCYCEIGILLSNNVTYAYYDKLTAYGDKAKLTHDKWIRANNALQKHLRNNYRD